MLKLVENKLSSEHKSVVYALVYHLILWASSDPLQSIIEAHEIGRIVGEQTGDFLHSGLIGCYQLLQASLQVLAWTRSRQIVKISLLLWRAKRIAP